MLVCDSRLKLTHEDHAVRAQQALEGLKDKTTPKSTREDAIKAIGCRGPCVLHGMPGAGPTNS